MEKRSCEGSDPQGEFKGKNILIQRLALADAAKLFRKSEADVRAELAASRQKLLAARAQRPRPHLDDKIITAWNGLMISAFARGAQVLDDPAYLASAQQAARFIHEHLWKDGQLLRSYREGAGEVGGFCDDYATLIQGLLDLYEADFDVTWLQWAIELQARQDALFLDAEHGGYFSVTKDAPGISSCADEGRLQDGAEPSPNSIAALNLLRLAQFTGRNEYAAQATATLGAFAPQLSRRRLDRASPQMLTAPRRVAGQAASDRHRRGPRRRRHARVAAGSTRAFHPGQDSPPGGRWCGAAVAR